MSVTHSNYTTNQAQHVPSQETLQLKQLHLYFEMRMQTLLITCLTDGSEDPLFSEVEQYKKIDSQLAAMPAAEEALAIDHLLKSLIVTLSQARKEKTVKLDLFFKKMKGGELQPVLEEIFSEFNHLIAQVNLGREIKLEAVNAWEKKVEQFQERFFNFLEKKFHLVWKSNFSNIIRKGEILSLYLSWERHLAQTSQGFSQLGPITTAIQIKQLLGGDKRSFFCHYFSHYESERIALLLCSHRFHKRAHSMLSFMDSEIDGVKNRIFAYEQTCLRRSITLVLRSLRY